MNLPGLAWRHLWARPLTSLLNLGLLTLGLTSVALGLLVRDALDQAFTRDLAGIDAVVGAKGSPLQLVLAGVFHLDVPPGNIAQADAQALDTHPQVARWIPLSLGDNVQGFRIVGTTRDYPAHFEAELARGSWWQAPMEAVLGAQVAQATGWGPGQPFHGAHGLAEGGHVHDEVAYTVTGVMAPCRCVLDRLVLTATESVWKVHDAMHGIEEDDQEAQEALAAEREITLALVRYRSPLAAVSFPREINQRTRMQAAAPAVEITRLMAFVGAGTRVLQAMSAAWLLVASLAVFIALWGALRERRDDLALLRLLGLSPSRLGALLALQAVWLAGLATVLGLGLALALAAWMGTWLGPEVSLGLSARWPPTWWAVPALALAVAGLAAALPAWRAYRLDLGLRS